MKKYLILLALLIGGITYGQVTLAKALKLVEITTAQRDGITIAAGQYPVIYNSTTGQFERYNGATWEKWVAGVAEADIVDLQTYTLPADFDTFAELDALVADKSLVNTADAQTLTNKSFSDNSFYLLGSADVTKRLAIEVDGVTTGQTRTLQVPDANTIIVGTDATQTLTNKTIAGASNTITGITSAMITDATIDELDLDASVNASLDLADSASQTDDQTAAEVTIADTGTLITATDVEGALAENRTAINLNTAKVSSDLQQADIDTSAEIAAIVTDESGSGNLIFSDQPLLSSSDVAFNSVSVSNINGATITSGTLNGSVTGANTGDQTITLTGDVTGTGTGSFATTIAADAVDEGMLNMFNAPTDEYYMKYSSVNGMTWALGSGGGDIYLHPYSDVSVDSLYIGTTAQIAARPLGTDVLSFATDASIELTDLTDVNTATVTNRNFLIADGTDWESRAIVKADLPSVTYREAIAISDNTTALTTGVKMTWYSPAYAITITDAEASLLTAATGAELIIDIHDDGTTIMGTNKLDIEVSEFHTKDATTQPAISAGSIAAGSKLEAEIDQIGSTIAGAGAIVYIYYTID